MSDKWIGKVTAKMKDKGTIGKFGKATPKKIAKDIKKGGKLEKEAVFARTMSGIAKKKKK